MKKKKKKKEKLEFRGARCCGVRYKNKAGKRGSNQTSKAKDAAAETDERERERER